MTKFLIELLVSVEHSDERIIDSYFHVLNDLERIGDHVKNLHEISLEMIDKRISFSDKARQEIYEMFGNIIKMFSISKTVFDSLNRDILPDLASLEENVDI